MCTLTIFRKGDVRLVTMNRDEQKTRGPEIPPAYYSTWLGPKDSESDGTWMGVNEAGVTLCLLNRYEDAALYEGEITKSRGTVIPSLFASYPHEEIDEDALGAIDANGYAPFTLVLIGTKKTYVSSWNGTDYRVSTPDENEWQMVSSSSFKESEVLAWRENEFKKWLENQHFEGEIPSFNMLQPEGLSTHSPLMVREKTMTRSITQTGVSPKEGVSLRYWGNILALNADAPDAILNAEKS